MATPLRTVSLQNGNNLRIKVLNYGAIIQKLEVKNTKGGWVNVVLGFEDPSRYLEDPFGLGACIGRYAGRISGGGFSIDGTFYSLPNEDGVHLHGGEKGFSKRFWEIDEVHKGEEPFIKLSYKSLDGEEGYPGNLKVEVTYLLSREDELIITYHTTTDKATVVNLTNHSYFNLGGRGFAIGDHPLQIRASRYLEAYPDLLPTGNILKVQGTPFDFRQTKEIGMTRLDDTFLLDQDSKHQIVLYAPSTGISMKVSTDQPAVVVFTPAWGDAICFETQHLPDTPNQPHFPTTQLRPGEQYHSETRFFFG